MRKSPAYGYGRRMVVAIAVCDGKTLREAGDLIGVSSKRAGQIIARMLRILMNRHYRRKLEWPPTSHRNNTAFMRAENQFVRPLLAELAKEWGI